MKPHVNENRRECGCAEQTLGRIGILYYAWQGKSGDHGTSLQKQGFPGNWKLFMEQVLTISEELSDSLIGWQWMKDDLYVYLTMPDNGLDNAEEWLLTSSENVRRRLETCVFQRWNEQNGRDTELHAGVSIMENERENSKHNHQYDWYKGMKQAIVHGQQSGSVERSLRRIALESLIREQSIYPVYQPIFSLSDYTVFGFESLTRCPDNPWFNGPLSLFTFAEQEGIVYALDRLAREKAIEGCRSLRQDQKIFINIMASIMDDPQFSPGLTRGLLERCGLSPHNVVFEITERSSIEDFSMTKKMLAHYRNQGYQIAIDDVGAGYSSLQSIVELRPDFIKVDRSLVKQVHKDEMKEHILGTFVQFAEKMGIRVIAEGIEEHAELEKVKEMGIHFAQGFLLGRPAPLL